MTDALDDLRVKMKLLKNCHTKEAYEKARADIESIRLKILAKNVEDAETRKKKSKEQVEEFQAKASRAKHLAEINRYGRG